MKSNILLLALLCLQMSIFAQSPGFYIYYPANDQAHGPFTMPTIAIADDFGPRDLDDGFHGGVDFNCYQGAGDAQKWRPCVSPQAGVIADFDKMTFGTSNGYKYGLVNVGTTHTLLFGHLFDNGGPAYSEYNSSIVFGKCLGINDDKWGLLLDFKNSAGNPLTICYGQVAGATFRVGIPPNHKDYITTNIVNTTDPFFPIGNSPNYTAHLHLNTLPYNTEISTDAINGDPTQYLNIDRPTYSAKLSSKDDANAIVIHYPGTEPTKLKTRVTMLGEEGNENKNRYNHLMDLNKVEFQIKKSTSSTYANIKGNLSEALISEGGRLGESVTNHAKPIDKTNWGSNGINSNAYNGATSGANAQHPWDDYYFIDFVSRIHKNHTYTSKLITDVPANTRYIDGDYNFRVKNTTSSNISTTNVPQTVIIDNFKPFITKISALADSRVFYELKRDQTEGATATINDGKINNKIRDVGFKGGLPFGVNYKIDITTSEPMQNVKIAHKKSTAQLYSTPVVMLGSGTNFSGSISSAGYGIDDIINIQFYGQDVSSNQIMNIHGSTFGIVTPNLLPTGNNPSLSVTIPTRNGSGNQDWTNLPTNSGHDQVDIRLHLCAKRSSSTGDQCEPLLTLESEVTYPSCLNGHIKLSGTNFDPLNYSITWSDASGNPLPEYGGYDEFDAPAGMYCYNVEALDDCCSVEGCVEIFQENMDDKLDITFDEDINLPACGNMKGRQVIKNVEGLYNNGTSINDFTYEWSISDQNFKAASGPAGTHTVKVTEVVSGCTNMVEFNIEDASFTVSAEVIQPNCNEPIGSVNLTMKDPNNIESNRSHTILWSNGETDFHLTDLAPGVYTYTVTDSDGNLCTIAGTISINEFIPENYIILADKQDNCICSNGACRGWMKAAFTGESFGVPTFKWFDASGSIISIKARTSLICAGTYTVKCSYIPKEGLQACTIEKQYLMSNINCAQLELIKVNSLVNVSQCDNPQGDGSIDISNVSGSNLLFEWSGPNDFNSVEEDISSLIQGMYELKVSTDDGCIIRNYKYKICCCDMQKDDNGVKDPFGCGTFFSNFDVIGEVTNASTNISFDGSVHLQFIGNTNMDPHFFWTGPNGYESNNVDISNLSVGLYTLKVTIGCKSIERSWRVGDQSICDANMILFKDPIITCILEGKKNGSIQTFFEGGQWPYIFQWSNGSNAQNISSNISKTYTLTITDSNGCTASDSYFLNSSNQELDISYSLIPPANCLNLISPFTWKVNVKSGNPPIKFGNSVETSATDFTTTFGAFPRTTWEKQYFPITASDACNFNHSFSQVINCNDFCPPSNYEIGFTHDFWGCIDVDLDDGTRSSLEYTSKNSSNNLKFSAGYYEDEIIGTGKKIGPEIVVPGVSGGDMLHFKIGVLNQNSGCFKIDNIFAKQCKDFWDVLWEITKHINVNIGGGGGCVEAASTGILYDCGVEMLCEDGSTKKVDKPLNRCWVVYKSTNTSGYDQYSYELYEWCPLLPLEGQPSDVLNPVEIVESSVQISEYNQNLCRDYVKPVVNCEDEIELVYFDERFNDFNAYSIETLTDSTSVLIESNFNVNEESIDSKNILGGISQIYDFASIDNNQHYLIKNGNHTKYIKSDLRNKILSQSTLPDGEYKFQIGSDYSKVLKIDYPNKIVSTYSVTTQSAILIESFDIEPFMFEDEILVSFIQKEQMAYVLVENQHNLSRQIAINKSNSSSKVVSLPLGINYKQCEVLSSNKLILGGDFINTVILGGDTLYSDVLKPVFIVLDQNLEISKTVVDKAEFAIAMRGFTTNKHDRILYHGRSHKESEFSGRSCVYIKEIQTDCLDCNEGHCSQVSLDITYSEHTGKFCSFYKRDVNDTKMYSSWIEPSTQTSIDSFLSITLIEIDVNSVRFGGTSHIFIVGKDKNDSKRTKTIKFDYSTRQIIWETWTENFQIVDVMEYTSSDTIFSLGYSYPGQQWRLKGHNVSTGQEVYSQPFNMKSIVTKIFSECSGINIKTKNLYAYVPNTSLEIVYISPYAKWTKPLPPVLKVRDIVITRYNQVIVGGDFTGTIVINDSTYVADTLNIGVFITYDSTGQIIKVNFVKETKHFVLHKMTTDGYGMIGYTGYTLTSGGGSAENFTYIDSIIGDEGVCVKVGGFSLGSTDGSGLGFRSKPIVERPQYFPNPFTNSISIALISSTDTEANLDVYDAYGRIIFTDKLSVQTGRNTVVISQFENVPLGVYIVKCKVGNQEFTNRVIKIN